MHDGRYLAECAQAGIDANRHAAGPLPALTALDFFKERAEVALGVRLAPTAQLRQDVRELLDLGFSQLPLEECDELHDLAAADAERFEDEMKAWQAAHARRRAGEKRKRGA
uniref:Uncharacterized protein n=1 Tax=Haptolina brevifila TaxID=156173 RepID=A0A7S2DBB1_9EUKA|mmetsp:Transcript_35714/g.71086  ORF Transcript_35714/g.71086 Transcript_35714/m.71086 type:complete len:111 (+) Transcript_35714:60-392(+)